MSGNDDKIESGYVGVQELDVFTNLEPAKPYQVKSPLFRECLAEFLGTMVMIMFGDGVVAQVVLSEGTKGEYININLCWGLGVLFGIHVSGGVSGAHLNPAVTTTLAWFGRMEWKKVPYYIVSQILGAFAAAFIVWVVYYPMFNTIDPNKETTQGVFATYPYSNDVPVGTCFLTEVVGTALLMGCIFAIGDELNKPANPYTQPGAVALLVVAIGMAFGMNSGYAINPARDFGPRLFSWIAGWGSEVFTLRDSYFWVPIVGPLLGGPIGAGVYVGLIEHHCHDAACLLLAPTQAGTPATDMHGEHVPGGQEGRRRSAAASAATRSPRATSREGWRQACARLPGARNPERYLHKYTNMHI